MKTNRSIALMLIFLTVFPLLSATGQALDGKLDDGLDEVKGFAPVLVRMEDQLFSKGGDYERFCEEQPRETKRLELRGWVIETLKAKADQAYAQIEDALERLIEQGHVRHVQRYWIVNGFACEATAAGREVLADMKPVGFVYRQRYGAQHRTPGEAAFEADQSLAALYTKLLDDNAAADEKPIDFDALQVPWHLKLIRADRVWDTHGITGKGVVVAVLDDGMMTVPALRRALWHNPNEQLNGQDDDGNGYIDDVFGYNFRQNNPYPTTPTGHRHGTLCAGIIAARPTPGDQPIATSVAPGSRIMPLLGNGQLRAYEYALENGADVLSMSYTFEPRAMGNYRGLYRTAHEHLAAAGVVSVGGAGNYAQQRPVGQQIGSTKDIPCVIAAAGVGLDGKVTAFSSRGPVSWKGIRYYDPQEPAASTVSKPDVTTCNAGFAMWTKREVWTGSRAGRLREVVYEDEQGYVLAIGPRGNSFAGPHAAGVAALMLEANPQFPVWHLQRLMESTCKDMGEPGRDTTHGAGMIQADKAVQAALDF